MSHPDNEIRRVMEVGAMPHNITHIERIDVPDSHVAIRYWQFAALVSGASLGLGSFVGFLLAGG